MKRTMHSGVILLIAVLSLQAGASHFRGGTISWKYLGPSGDAHNIEMSYKFGWRRDWESPGCDDFAIQSQVPGYEGGVWNQLGLLNHTEFNETAITCTAYDINENWAYGYNSFVATVVAAGPSFDMSYTGGNWIDGALLVSGGGWALTAGNIDLDIRSDTGLVNNPPTALSSPIVKLSQGCPETVFITHLDRDSDRVTCRYAISGRVPDECDTACNGPTGAGYAHFTLNETACSIYYDGGGFTGLVGVSLVLSDYPETDIVLGGSRIASVSDYLSEIPLQFLMQIDEAISCNQVPTYPTQTIQDDATVAISFDGKLNKTLYAYSSSPTSRIIQFVVLGPLGMTVSQVWSLGSNLYAAGLEWAPTDEQEGDHNVCYYASDSDRNVGRKVCFTASVSHADPCTVNNGGCSDVCSSSGNTTTCSCSIPCWSLDIDGSTCLPNMNITCNGDGMTLSIADCASSRTVVVGDYQSQMAKPECQSTHIGNKHVLEWKASTCGFEYEVNSVEVEYTGKMWIWHAVNTGSSVITRGEYRIIPVTCRLPVTDEVSGDFVPELPFNHESFPINVNVEGFGAFSFYFEFYRSSAFSSVVPPAEYPMSVIVNKRFHFAVGAIGQSGFTFFTQECEATTSSADSTHPDLSYTFIRDGCLMDPTLIRIPSGNPMEERFSMEAFEFNEKINSLRANADISIQCKVMICDSANLTSRCFQGCNSPTRKRRSVFGLFGSSDDRFDVDNDDDDGGDTPSKRSGVSESPLQRIRGRFILLTDSNNFDTLTVGKSTNIFWALIAIGLLLVAIVLVTCHRVLRSRTVLPPVTCFEPPQCKTSDSVSA